MNIENLKADALSDSSDNNLEILFLDTFSSSIEDRAIDDANNVGLVQFSSPVIIHELRIIPLSTLISAESLRGARLGATIPSSFDVHFYVNDLKAKETSTFLDIGRFAYREHERNTFKPQLQIPTDGLFLRGCFESLTIAVIGVVTDLSRLVPKKHVEQPNSFNLSDEIKSIDEDVNSIEIKEPDDVDGFTNDSSKDEIICAPHHSANNENCTGDLRYGKSSQHIVLNEDVHSLSPSPVNFTRLRSPSPSPRLRPSTPKSISSGSSKDLRSKEQNRDYGYNKFKYSSSPSNSPFAYSLRNSVPSPSSRSGHHSRHRRPSAEKERDHLRGSSSLSHQRDRHPDDRYSREQRHRSRRSTDRSPEQPPHLRSSSNHFGSSRYNRSRSRSKESLYGRTQYLQSLERQPRQGRYGSRSPTRDRDRRRSGSLGRNNDTRSIHSDNRSMGSNSSRNRSGGGPYEPNDSHRRQHRDLSPKSSSASSKYHYTSVRSRRSRSISPDSRKRRHQSRTDSFSPYGADQLPPSSVRSPDNKRSRYSTRHPIASPHSPASFDKSNNSIRSLSPSPSPKVSSKVVESIVTSRPASVNKNDNHHNTLSPFNMSPHSSLSNVSLKSLEQNNLEDNLDETDVNSKNDQKSILSVNGNSSNFENGSINDIELFEPLSPSDDLLDMPEPEVLPNIIDCNENYETISLSSDADMENDIVSEQLEDKPSNGESKGELLEVISSDEEYEDDLNAALSSDNIDYAKNYLDNAGSDKYEDDEMDNAFDLKKSLFDPFLVNQLESLCFPFNSNHSTTFIDQKLFNVIVKMVEDKFTKIYSLETVDSERQNLINETWVKDVELLASEIMKLTSPINCPFDQVSSAFDQSEQDLNGLTGSLIAILVAITKDGLNFELATSQKQALKVRHLKAGIKLFTALFSSLDLRTKSTNIKLSSQLLSANLPYDLLLLYNKPYMTLSLRLLILNGLTVLCDYPEGVEYLCNQTFTWSDVDKELQDNGMTEGRGTIYQYILTLILGLQKSRLTSVFEELLDKIHLYEHFKALSLSFLEDDKSSGTVESTVLALLLQLVASFSRLSNRIHRPLRLLPNICQYEIKTAVYANTPLLLLASSTAPDNSAVNSDQFNFIKTRLSCRHISCSSSKIGFFSQKAFYRYLQHFDILQLFVRILSISNEHHQDDRLSSNQFHLFEVIISLLDMITSHQQGLKFLLQDEQNTELTNQIHRQLISSKLNSQEPSLIDKKLCNFGSKFLTRLYAFNLIDKILHNIYSSEMERGNIEDVSLNHGSSSLFCKNGNYEAIEHLARLYTLVYLDRSVFRDSVISLLTMDHNFDVLLAFLLPITSQMCTPKMTLISEISSMDSVSFVYATKLTVSCIQYLPEKNFIHFYDTYGKLLLKSIETVQSLAQNAAVKFHKSDIYQNHILRFASLANWLSPLKMGNFNSHEELAIRMFVTILKKHHDACRDKFSSIENYIHRVFYFEPEIITATKVLVSLCDPTSDYAKNQEPDIQLKYKYSLLHCYSNDCVSYLLTLLEALHETCLRPSHQSNAYSFDDSYISLFLKSLYKSASSTTPQKQHSLQQHSQSFAHQGTLILEFIRPSIRLLRLILNYLFSCVGSNFTDSTPVPILLKIYQFLDFYQLSVISNDRLQSVEIGAKAIAASIQQEIIDILRSIYTCVYVEQSSSEDALNKSVWTKMLRCIFQFTTASPKNFSSGLDVLSKVLPPPFPMDKPMSDFEVANLVNYRKLWSAHLHVLKSDLEQTISHLLICDSSIVQQRLRIVCDKLSDLYTPTVTILARLLTEFLVHNLNICPQLAWDGEHQVSFRQCTTNCLKTLDLILRLFSRNVAFRIGILNAFYLLANVDSSRKDSSKVYTFIRKIFECLNQRKLDCNVQLSSLTLFKNILANADFDALPNEALELSTLIIEYFDKNRNVIAVKNGQFKFSDKLASKYISLCSESLNDFFGKRLSCGNLNGGSPVNVVSSGNPIKEESNEGITENIGIYSPEFISILSAVENGQLDSTTDSNEISAEFKINLAEFSRKYCDKDPGSLEKTLEVLYEPIVEPPEPNPEKLNDEPSRMHSAPMNTKRLSSSRRGRFGVRLDPFRSRMPNSSRQPSIHIDEFLQFEALGQRHDPVGGKSRSSHLHLNSGHSSSSSLGNNSSYSGGSKHQEYMRKKNLSSHHSVHRGDSILGPYNEYYANLKGGLIGNASASNTSHYKQKP